MCCPRHWWEQLGLRVKKDLLVSWSLPSAAGGGQLHRNERKQLAVMRLDARPGVMACVGTAEVRTPVKKATDFVTCTCSRREQMYNTHWKPRLGDKDYSCPGLVAMIMLRRGKKEMLRVGGLWRCSFHPTCWGARGRNLWCTFLTNPLYPMRFALKD